MSVASRTWRRPSQWPPRVVVRRASGLRTFESVLYRCGLGPVAGVDEAGRGACAGPLVVAACVLGDRPRSGLADLDDSKKLTPATRELLFGRIVRSALSWSVVTFPAEEIDRIGIHVANIEGMRRAIAGLEHEPGYVLTDGFRVPGLPVPSLPVIGGDASAASIAAASILAKVTRDRMMVEMHGRYPGYGFSEHKGYSTPEHTRRLRQLGPCPEHRFSYANVEAAKVGAANPAPPDGGAARLVAAGRPGDDGQRASGLSEDRRGRRTRSEGGWEVR